MLNWKVKVKICTVDAALLAFFTLVLSVTVDRTAGAQIRTFTGHTNGVFSVAFSRDGECVLAGSADTTARLWDAETGNSIATFIGHTMAVSSVAYSPVLERDILEDAVITRGTVLTGSLDGTAKLWYIASGKCIRTFTDDSMWGGVWSVAYSPDALCVLTGSDDGAARLWDPGTGKVIRTFSGHNLMVHAVAFSPDGTKILTGSVDKTAKLWDIASGKVIHTFTGHRDPVESVAFSPDGAQVLTGGGIEDTAKLWDIATNKEIRTFLSRGNIFSAKFSPNGTKIVTGGSYVELWSTTTGRQDRSFSGHSGIVESVAYSPDGTKVLSGSHDGTVKLWSVGAFGCCGGCMNAKSMKPSEAIRHFLGDWMLVGVALLVLATSSAGLPFIGRNK